MKHKVKVLLIVLMWLWSCNGGFSQNLFSTAPGGVQVDKTVELGVKFTTSQAVQLTALRFYKPISAGNYTLNLYADGVQVLSVPYVNPATGWAQVPVSYPLQPGVNYIASYLAPQGYIAANPYSWPVTSGPITASMSIYKYGGGLPTDSYGTSNYFADIAWAPLQARTDTIVIHDTIRLQTWYPVAYNVQDSISWGFPLSINMPSTGGTVMLSDSSSLYQAIFGQVTPTDAATIDSMPRMYRGTLSFPDGKFRVTLFNSRAWVRQKYVNGKWVTQ